MESNDKFDEQAFTAAATMLTAALRRKEALDAIIDSQIAAIEAALRKKRDRRQSHEPHDPERRDGFDRRAMVAPIKD